MMAVANTSLVQCSRRRVVAALRAAAAAIELRGATTRARSSAVVSLPSANVFLSRACSTDTRRREAHGGDDIYRVRKLVCDFSVTTNALGPVPSALSALQRLTQDVDVAWITPRGGDVKAIVDEGDGDSQHLASSPAVEHYPKRHDAELAQLTAAFLRPSSSVLARVESQLLFGNGASELIDLIARAAPPGPFSLNPHVDVQFREYQRACLNAGRKESADPKDASLICLVNPNNPTGDFLERADMEAWIEENVSPGSWVIVDESMLFWAGPRWHERGVSDDLVVSLAKRHVHVFLVHSWTKIFACTGLRIGSVLCPSVEKRKQLESLQVPWSVNAFAQAYLKAALQDRDYLERTWSTTPSWHAHMVTRLQRLYPSWKFLGQPWLSWVWIDTGDENLARSVYEVGLECGCPVRYGAFGYGRPTVVRIAVRRPYDFSVLYQALLQRECINRAGGDSSLTTFGTYADVHPSVIEGVSLVHVDDLKPHEQVITDRVKKLMAYTNTLPSVILPAIIVDSKYQVVIDGHHRLELFKQAGMQIVPAVMVNYVHGDILVNPPGHPSEMQKETVIASALKNELLPPKSTQHMVRSRGGALLPIVVLAPQIAELELPDP
eukprot:TRINITY_DN73399_c0_g1_i1.p1 TRINITY_DN73399_c0_g1~~TRINITY_DN73399_c0_g1_i1.p1  ORF type:complete len:630 (-),score=92.61 TRINITY_DN73399_c0_g1_i1:98-1924(-)